MPALCGQACGRKSSRPARRAGAWASTAFRALQNALGSVAPSGGACGVPYTPAPDLSRKRGGWRRRSMRYQPCARLRQGASTTALRLCFGMHQCVACFLCRQAWQTPFGSFALCAGPEHGHPRLSARCKTPSVLLPPPAGPAACRTPRPLTFPEKRGGWR